MTKAELNEHRKTIEAARAAWEQTGKAGGPDFGDWAKAWAAKVLEAAESMERLALYVKGGTEQGNAKP